MLDSQSRWPCYCLLHTMRCYNCTGFGYKAQTCASPRRQPMKSPSYTSARRTNESWKMNNAVRLDQRTSNHSQGHSQVWVKKNLLLNLNEVDCSKVGGCHMASQTWSLSKTLMHFEFMEFGGWTHRQLLVTPSIVTGPRIVVTAGLVIGGAGVVCNNLMK